MSPDLRASLAMMAEAASEARDPWWIIGSAAVALHGADPGDVHDVDLLMSVTDAADALRLVGGLADEGEPSMKFRSDVFGIWRAPPIPVEIFGGFSVASAGSWTTVVPATRQSVRLDGIELFVPSADELVQLLQLFGRPKDLARAAALEKLG